MAKPPKPSLSIVGASSGNPEAPPATLGAAGASAWREIMDEYGITDAGGLVLLRQVCEATDEIAANDLIIKRDGRLIMSRTGVMREHPLLKNQIALRSFLTRTLQRLGLNLEPVKPIGRPGGWGA